MEKTVLLPAGEKISIGRKSTCNLVINSPLISGIHCVLTVFRTSNSSTQTSISDTSSNGTWISTQTQDSQASFKSTSSQELTNKAEKLLKGAPRDIYPGDVIMLLAPQHKESGEYRFQLTSADSSGNYSLVQLEKTSDMKKRSPPETTGEGSQPVKKIKIAEADATFIPKAMLIPFNEIKDTNPQTEDPEIAGSPNLFKLEQCVFCLENYPVCEMVAHDSVCPSKTSQPKSSEKEHCQHCLKVFFLDELIDHSMTCSQRRDMETIDSQVGVTGSLEEWGEPVERCMQCFKDFPLSKLVHHSNRCKKELLGPKNRFKDFIPSVHDLDPMTAAVLTPIQRRAIDFVNGISKAESEVVHLELLEKVHDIGYSEKDLEITLQWVRRDAPIIIHLFLDQCLGFLIKDTHYRNLFETHTGGGGTDTEERIDWENRLFNNIYDSDVNPFDRVKYGVLNIVGDPRGVGVVSSYGDSFLQLKKVRLRSTFASTDTANDDAQLSCCEYYENVLLEYDEDELKAIIDVATRKKPFLRSDMIGSDYKEVQIHGPVSLSENVDCIVVNERHKDDTEIKKMLDIFVERNKCNLIWMEPEESINYPEFVNSDYSREQRRIQETTVETHAAAQYIRSQDLFAP